METVDVTGYTEQELKEMDGVRSNERTERPGEKNNRKIQRALIWKKNY